jgi:hypothetical protein
VIGQAAAETRSGFDDYLMAGANEFFGANRQESNAILVELNLTRNADDHGLSAECGVGSAEWWA